MGFQDYEVFNLSLLAKQCWRIILFYHVWWLIVSGKNAFPMEGYKLLNLDMRHRIGNGFSTSIDSNKWIPSFNWFTPSYFTSDEDRVRHLFLYYEAEAILQIPLNPSWPEDKLIWNFISNGIYTVKSGYKISMDFGEAVGLDSGTLKQIIFLYGIVFIHL
ncbi:hypothetical protein M9H77_02107 [Catharanthus roseus]|uniref:Uncharacterized protein n=1 Tax=Catharanthus roseus TaxID=4058 RepID=A0ACC0C7K2_CATRO|nr:hypothetical protein M9H77_02107 [Catharanthus roseus]